MPSATSVIEQKVEELIAEEQRLLQVFTEYREALKVVREKLRLLQSIKSEIGGGKPAEATEAVATPEARGRRRRRPRLRLKVRSENGAVPEGLKPAEAVKALLRLHPEGLPQKDTVLLLEDRIDSESSDKRRLLYNTIFNLRKRNIIRDVGGRIKLVNED